MANKLYEEQDIQNIANAIREKNGSSDTYKVSEMPDAIKNISGGGGDNAFEFGGLNAQLVASYDEEWGLRDTSFVIGSSASTSATSIKTTQSNRFTSASIDVGDKDIVIIQSCSARPTHSSTTDTGVQTSYGYVYTSYWSKKRTAPGAALTSREVHNSQKYAIEYVSGGKTTRSGSNYGFYMTPTAPTLSSVTAQKTPIRCSSPTLYYRASSGIESVENIKNVTACSFKWHVRVYLVDPQSSPGGAINRTLDEMLTVD